jgi:lipopolysaccharide/colanic/teichoic acid biosynthesis glycosyltransferase
VWVCAASEIIRAYGMKRTMDIVFAGTALLLLAPALAAVGIAIKLDSPGPVIFRQERVGRNFRRFWIYKFRTMVADAAAKGPPITASADPRVTRVGAWLRWAKVDELPQLWNVLRGDMSLVGPRPELPRYVDLFQAEYRELLQVRPGLTDPSTLKYADEARWLAGAADPEELYVSRILPDKLALARRYAGRSSLRSDLKLMALTLLRIWRRDDSR